MVIAFGAMLGFIAFLLVGPRDAGGEPVIGSETTVGTSPCEKKLMPEALTPPLVP